MSNRGLAGVSLLDCARQPEDREAGEPPYRQSRNSDVRNTFGDHRRTLPLLAAYLRGAVNALDVECIIPTLHREHVRSIFYMFTAFGITRQSTIRKMGVN